MYAVYFYLLFVGFFMRVRTDSCSFEPGCNCTDASISCESWNNSTLPNFVLSGRSSVTVNISNSKSVNSVGPAVISDITVSHGRFVHLYLVNNSIENVHCFAFTRHEYTLQTLDLTANNLTEVPGCSLKGMRGLRSLNLSNNHISHLDSYSFASLTNLTDLNIARNDILTVEHYAFEGLHYRLEHLNLEHNQLISVGRYPSPFPFSYSDNNLKSLKLAYNRLAELKLSFFRRMRHLDISHNLLRILTFNGYFRVDGSGNSLTVKVNNNKLNTVPSVHIRGLYGQTVMNLDLSVNDITKIGPYLLDFPFLFAHIEDNIVLNISNNKIHTISKDFIRVGCCENLRINLDLSDNKLENITFLTTNSYRVIYNNVDLTNNKITHINKSDVDGLLLKTQRLPSHLSNLHLGLDGNPFHCDCDLYWMRNESYKSIWNYPTCASPPNVQEYLATCFPASCENSDLPSPNVCPRIKSTSTTTSTTPFQSTSPKLMITASPDSFTERSNVSVKYSPLETPPETWTSGATTFAALFGISLILLLLVIIFLCLLWRRSEVPFKIASVKQIILPSKPSTHDHNPATTSSIQIETHSTPALNPVLPINKKAAKITTKKNVKGNNAYIYHNRACESKDTQESCATGEDDGRYARLDPLSKDIKAEPGVYEEIPNGPQVYENFGKH